MPTLELVLVFEVNEKFTVPLPVPVPETILIQFTVGDADHEQLLPAVTEKLPEPASAVVEALEGEIA